MPDDLPMSTIITSAIKFVSNATRDLVGADRCVVCGFSGTEMDSPRLCNKCASLDKPKRVSRSTWRLVRQFKETVPVCEQVSKPPEPVIISPVTFPKPHWTGRNRCG